MRDYKYETIVDRIGILTANFTAATTDIITSAAHGLKNSDMVVLTTTDTLPAGLSTSTVYWVIEAATNTFELSSTAVENYTTGDQGKPGTPVDITDTGTGTHTFTMHDIGKSINVEDYKYCTAAVHGASSANIDIGFVGSIGKSPTDDGCPDFSAAQAYNNSWSYVETAAVTNGTAVDGAADAISQTGTNKHEIHRINLSELNLKWLNIRMSGWSAGTVTVFVKLFNNG